MRKVSVNAQTAQTKTVLSYDDAEKEIAVMWEDGDEIALVFPHSADASSYVCSLSTELDAPNSVAKFAGAIDKSVTVANGYSATGYAVYPSSAVNAQGTFVFSLPSEQTAELNGGLQSGLNLSSGAVSLKKMVSDGETDVEFRNACSILRFTLADNVTSMMLTGTSDLSGGAPLVWGADGSLQVDSERSWTDGSASVTLLPAAGRDCFDNGVAYHLLVWPGEHTSLTLSLTYKDLGEFSKTTKKAVTLAPSKFYTLNFNPSSEELVLPLQNALTDVIGGLTDLEGKLEETESEIADMLAQIQSVTLMTEYLGDSAYAQYGNYSTGLQKFDISLNYLVKPESSAQALVSAFEKDHSVVSGILSYTKEEGVEVSAETLAVKSLTLTEVDGLGKVVTASIDASRISNEFYAGKCKASVALQIAYKKTDLLSDFAHLVPRAGSAIGGSYLKDIPAVPGASVVIPFSYAVSDPGASYTIKVEGYENVDVAGVTYNDSFKTGYLTVANSASKSLDSQSVTISLTVGSGDDKEVVSHVFTFVDNGARINLSSDGDVDYIGGDAVVTVTSQNLANGFLTLVSGSGVQQAGNVFTFDENSGGQRTAQVQYSVSAGSLQYVKSITLTQKAYNTSLSGTYYDDGQKVVLNQANASGCANYFNIVILGDGYKKKDLKVGGKFERTARSAMDSFFAVEPYKSFKNRFNVYMVAYESAEEGTDIRSGNVNKNTYFNTYCQGGGNTAAYADEAGVNKIISVVKSAVGSADAGSTDAQYYRSIAIVMVNTSEQAGSCGYPVRTTANTSVVGDGYASFAIAVLAANSTGTNGLVKHEAGGHAFGRLADEYHSGGTIPSDKKNELSDWHNKGWYWNVTTSSGSYYNFNTSSYSSSEVGFVEGAWGYTSGIYRPTAGGMMQNNNGVFNAPSRHAIYHRIIKESEGASAYSWSKFLEYDKINR